MRAYLVTLLVLSTALYACGAQQFLQTRERALHELSIALDEARRAGSARGEALRQEAIAAARREVHDSAAFSTNRSSERQPLYSFLRDLVARDELDSAEELVAALSASGTDVELDSIRVLIVLRQGNWQRAQDLAWSAVNAYPEHRAEQIQLWYETLIASPGFWRATPRSLQAGVDLDRIEALGGGSTITLKFKRAGETIAAFKPHQRREQSYYRGELAAYRLCAMIHCGFTIPHNEEVRIRVRDFLRLYGVSSLNSSSGYSRHFSDLIVTEDEGEQWILGTMKAWVPGFTNVPIEHTDAWDHLLSGYLSVDELGAMSFEDAISGFRSAPIQRVRQMLERAGDATALSFARELSNLHVFDLLLNNWDRYSERFPGANVQWNHGHFVSIDNGAVLQHANWGRPWMVQQRIRRVRVFSRSTINAIRWMELEAARDILLPPGSVFADEDERFELFCQRRQWLLEYIDGLIATYGEDAVLALP